MRNTRKVTNQLLELIEEGVLDPQTVLEACLSYMSEADVADMSHCNEFIIDDEDEDSDDDDEEDPCARAVILPPASRSTLV